MMLQPTDSLWVMNTHSEAIQNYDGTEQEGFMTSIQRVPAVTASLDHTTAIRAFGAWLMITILQQDKVTWL